MFHFYVVVPGFPQGRPALALRQHRGKGTGAGTGIVRREQVSGHTVLDQLAMAAHVRGADQLALGHRFQWLERRDHVGEAHGQARIHQHIDRIVGGADFAMRDLPGEDHLLCNAEALDGFQALARYEGIIPALESAHAVAHIMAVAKTLPRGSVVLVNLSGRGDKDVQSVAEALR